MISSNPEGLSLLRNRGQIIVFTLTKIIISLYFTLIVKNLFWNSRVKVTVPNGPLYILVEFSTFAAFGLLGGGLQLSLRLPYFYGEFN
jgi:hypothetical protein